MKAYVPRIPKMLYFLGLAVFKVELLALKVRSNFKKKIPPKKNVTKKRHGHNFDSFGPKRIARLLDIVEKPCYSFQTKKIKIVAVSFFLTLPICGDTPTFSALC